MSKCVYVFVVWYFDVQYITIMNVNTIVSFSNVVVVTGVNIYVQMVRSACLYVCLIV